MRKSVLAAAFAAASTLSLNRFGAAPTAIRRQSGKHKTPPFEGRVKIGDYSSLRKLLRAARRGKLPAERLRIIKDAEESATSRWMLYQHSSALARHFEGAWK